MESSSATSLPDFDPPPEVYFAVSVPSGSLTQGLDLTTSDNVFLNQTDALRYVKRFPGSRFKCFNNRFDAEQFANGNVDLFNSPARVLNSGNNTNNTVKVGEEKSPFRGPKTQDFTALRKLVEKGEIDEVKRIIWDNPRYLISNGDTPTVLHEAFRYNIMHVCAKIDKADICQLVIDTLENAEFMRLMYPNDSEDIRAERITFILDLYLNMPEKGECASPVHFCCKFGHADVLEVLLAHPRTKRDLRNKFGEYPRDIILTRAKNSSQELREQIERMLKAQYFVPLFRTDDNSVKPMIGEPWSPDPSSNDVCPRSPAKNSPLDPDLCMHAVAGPMTASDAEEFHKKWSSVKESPQGLRRHILQVRRQDCEKGFERLGRELAKDLHVPWSEYWSFLEEFADFSSKTGIEKLEIYLKYLCKNLKNEVHDCHVSNNDSFLNHDSSLRNNHDSSFSDLDNSSNEPNYHSTSFKSFRLDVSNNSEGDSFEKEPLAVNKSSVVSSPEQLNNNSCASDSLDDLSKCFEALRIDSPNLESESFSNKPECAKLSLENDSKSEKRDVSCFDNISFDDLDLSPKFTSSKPVKKRQSIGDMITGLVKSFYPFGKKEDSLLEEEKDENADDDDDDEDDADLYLDASTDADSDVEAEFFECDIIVDERSGLDSSNVDANSSTPLKTEKFDFPPEGLFLQGSKPTKLDTDVLRAINSVEVSEDEFPFVSCWLKSVQNFSETEQNSWPSPAPNKIKSMILSPLPRTPGSRGQSPLRRSAIPRLLFDV